MLLDCNDQSNPTPKKSSTPSSQDLEVAHRYDAEGRRIDPTDLEADPAIILFNGAAPVIARPADLEAACQEFKFDSVPEPFAWTGRELDAEVGFEYNRAGRCFDPTIGRWISESPLGFEPADSDRYPYMQ